MRFAVPALALLLTACAATETTTAPSDTRKGEHGTRWTKAAVTDEQFAREHYVCMKDSTVPTRSFPFGLFGAGAHVDPRLYIACMTAQGYRRVDR